jgi:rod shape-determining protein MreB
VRAIGLEAKRMLGRTPEGIVAIRPMRDGVIADVDMAELMLRHYLGTVLPRGLFRIKPRVVIGVPSGITEMERRAVRSAVSAAGAKEVFLISEPMAAAIGVGLPVLSPHGSMVVNVGGGTTEIGVIALSGIVADASIRVGGNEFDEAIMAFVRKSYNLLIGEATAESIKIQVGSARATGQEREMDVNGRDLVSGIPKTIRVYSEEIREAIQEPVQAIVGAVRRALEVTPPELAADIVDEGITMTGGGALIKGLDALIAEETGLPIHLDSEPLSCVVRGAGMVLDEWEKYQGVLAR